MKKLKFLLSLITQDNDYQQAQAKAAMEVANRLGVDLETVYAESDSVTQSVQLLDAIHKYKSELNGVIVEPAGGTIFPQAAKSALDLGILWIVLNRDADAVLELQKSQTITFAVSSDHLGVGKIQAQQLTQLLPDGGNVLLIHGPSSTRTAQQRMEGLQQALPSNIALKVLKSSNWTEEAGHHALSSWLRLATSQKSGIRAIAAHNDSIAVGAKRALEEAARSQTHLEWTDLALLGIDGLPKTGRAWVNAGLLKATVVVPPVAGAALERAVDAIKTGVRPPHVHMVACESYPALHSLRPLGS